MDDQGNAVVTDELLGRRLRLRAVWRPTGGQWSAPRFISPPEINAHSKVALSNGVATFAWAGEVAGGGEKVEARRLVNGELSDVAILSSPPRGDLVTDLDVSGDGRTVAWTHDTEHEALVRVRHWTNGRWGRTRTLGEGGVPDIASNDRGGTIVAYQQTAAANRTLLLSRRLRPSGWARPRRIARTITDPRDSSALTLNNRGVATAVGAPAE